MGAILPPAPSGGRGRALRLQETVLCWKVGLTDQMVSFMFLPDVRSLRGNLGPRSFVQDIFMINEHTRTNFWK